MATVITKPNIIWQGSPNFWTGRAGYIPVAICDHIMEGTMEATNSWFKNLRSEASAHFGVAKDGRTWQWVKEADSAWGNGILQSPDMSVGFIAECANKDINPNYRTISIEHEGNTGDPFTEPQYQSTLALHRYLCGTYKIVPDRQHIVGHYQIMSKDRANCPGKGFPWSRLMSDLAKDAAWTGSVNDPFGDPNAWHCLDTGFWVTNEQHFLDFWRTKGGLAIFGFPKSGAAPDARYKDAAGNVPIVQWFERARFEWRAGQVQVQLGLVGAELLAKL
jgi:hypothetical protein